MDANIDAAPADPDRLSIRRLLPLLALLSVPVLCYLTGAYRYFSFEVLAQYYATLKGWIGAHFLLAVLAYIAFYAAATALSLPAGLVISVAGGMFFGWMIGGPATVIGATIGATILFKVAQSSFGAGLVKQAGPWLEKLSAGFKKDAFNYLLFLRLVPAFPFVVVNLVPAILGMPLWSYVAATFIGIIPGTLTFSYLGTGLESVIQAATASYQACLSGKSDAEAAACHLSVDVGKLVTPQILIALCALAAISLLPILIKRFAGRKT